LNSIRRLTAGAFGAAIITGSLAAASAQSPAAAAGSPAPMMATMPTRSKLTAASSLLAVRRLANSATLFGQLRLTSSCNKVAFQQAPMQIFPPQYNAVQIAVQRKPCAQGVNWFQASIAIPPNAPYVTVHAINGTFKVLVR
jgi:hypothetical protein